MTGRKRTTKGKDATPPKGRLKKARGKKGGAGARAERLEFCAKAFESAKDGLFIIDMNGGYRAVNPSGCAMFGYTLDEFLSSDVRLLLFPEEAKTILETGPKRWKSGAYLPEYRMRRKDGSEIWIEISISPFTIGGKKFCLGVKRDITEQRRMKIELERARVELEERVRERTEKLREAQSIAHVGSWEHDLVTGRIAWTDETYRIFGLRPGEREITIEGLLDMIHPDDRERVKKTIGESIGESKEYSNDYRIVRPDKTVRAVYVKAMPVLDVNARPVNFVGTLQDITERKFIEEELRKSSEMLNEAQRVARVGSWEWDISKNTIFWTDEIYRIFGLRPREFGATYEAFLSSVHPEDRVLVKKSVDDALSRKKPYSIDHRIVLPHGEVRTVHEQAEVTFDRNGKPLRMVGTVHDITDRKRFEDEALRARKLESVGALAGALAHDFNNLLVGILGNISLARTGLAPDDKTNAFLSEAEKAVARAKNLTKQFLTFSKGGEPIKEKVDICGLLRNSSDFVMKDSRLPFQCVCPRERFYANVDAGQILQVFNNILLNAIEASEKGGSITADTDAVAVTEEDNLPVPGGDYVRVTIKDSGRGIPPEHLPKVFEPFFTTKEKAAGLGLTVAYSVVKKHGGHITVESEPGKGASFHVYLPSSPAVFPGHAAAEAPVKGRGRVLVMDDEELVRDVSGEMLKTLGYEPSFAKDGIEALKKYKEAMTEERPFNLVIMDLTVPGGMGGKEAVKALLEMDPKAKAIVSSGYSTDPIMSEFGRHGFKGVITKPYRVSEFSRAVRDVIEGNS